MRMFIIVKKWYSIIVRILLYSIVVKKWLYSIIVKIWLYAIIKKLILSQFCISSAKIDYYLNHLPKDKFCRNNYSKKK